MDLQPITMDPAAAQEAFREYRAAFMADRNAIDGELMRGYRALGEGKSLIRLSEAIKAGGADEGGKPRIAIARADERSVTFSRRPEGAVDFRPGERTPRGNWPVTAADRAFSFPAGTLPALERSQSENAWIGAETWAALTPIIPPRFRPRSFNPATHHVLWEAVWTRSRARAPHDPALLKHLGGDLWVVLAVWDLTELERAVLEFRG